MRPDPTDLDLMDGETASEYLCRQLPSEWFETDAAHKTARLVTLCPVGAERAVPAVQELSEEEREAVLFRFVHYVSEGAIRAAAFIASDWTLARPDANTDLSLPAFGSVDEARDWMRANSGFLASCAAWARSRGRHETVCRTVESAEAYMRETGEFDALVGLLRVGLDSSRALGDTVWQARMRNLVGLALLTDVRTKSARTLDEADGEFAASYALAAADGDDRGRASALEGRGLIALADDRHADALSLFTRVRPLKEAVGCPRGLAGLDLLVGRTLINMGRFDHALEYLDAALEFFVAPGDGSPVDEVNIAKVRQERGRVLVAKRRWSEAQRELDLALMGFAARGLVHQSARVREMLAGHAQLTGAQDWKTHLVEAERLYRENGNEAEARRLRTYLE
ncbi:tetratricopeptide repeat protein [Nocardiopsis valliformis]|uniref:tetratricopeptide repeat protein n=1 Tax=Nocardiopsis valliformis TaxID=239974 RepID=UPI00034824BE|nr:tetratricopeptide repeat protein [Nocardiopsis valliformis]